MRLAIWLLSALLVFPASSFLTEGPLFVSVALADDDDGGDDDGGDDGDDGGGRNSRGGSRADRSGGDSGAWWLPARPRQARPQQRRPRQAVRRTAPTPPAPTAMPNEIVLLEVTGADLDRIVADGFSIVARAPLILFGGEIARVTPPGGVNLEAARARLQAIAPAAIVDPNHLYRPVEMPCRHGHCPAFEMIGWAVPPASCSLAATIGMIDTEVNTDHEALRGRSVEIVSVMSDDDQASAAVHGTAVAALLVGDDASRTPGLLPAARLIAVEAFHRDRAGDASDVYKLVRGLDALSARGVRVVNMSFAGPANLLLEQAVARAAASGMILVTAAGNRGPNAPPAFPGAYADTIAVTAVDRTQQVYRQAGRGDHIAFAAPGVRIWTAASISGGRFRSGTSYAVPFVTAAIAAALAEHPDHTREQLVADLAAQSGDLGEAGRDATFGFGLIKAKGC